MSDVYDIVIIGGGPAGLTAGLYAARARMKAVLVERMGFGGQLLTYERVDNYPGFPEGVGAFGLSELISAQALRFGLQTRNADVLGLDVNGPVKTVRLADGTIQARTLVIASGASPHKLGIKGEIELTGRGVSYCAVCDAPFYRGQDVAVVGGGDTAVEEAIYLTKFANRVYLIHRRDKLRATPIICEKAFRNEKLQFVLSTIVTEVQGGDGGVESLVLQDRKTGGTSRLPVAGVFMFVGIRPNCDFLPPEIQRDECGFICTDKEMATSVPGVFAAGDVRVKALRQIVTAVGDGATAAFNAGKYVENNFH
ncbi:MAG: thioredoxin-disulfide reductase [Syntrophobacteraceae bacterium]|nr:thioredoxin-disulfide reductase [Desulfobacteraceae bacterium]